VQRWLLYPSRRWNSTSLYLELSNALHHSKFVPTEAVSKRCRCAVRSKCLFTWIWTRTSRRQGVDRREGHSGLCWTTPKDSAGLGVTAQPIVCTERYLDEAVSCKQAGLYIASRRCFATAEGLVFCVEIGRLMALLKSGAERAES
jgi:hypothetical protein